MRASRRRFVAAGAAALGTAGIVKAPARAAQFEFKGASNLPVAHPSSVHMKEMWAAIDAESGGRTQSQFFPNSQLGGDLAMLSQLRVGAIQFFLVSPGILQTAVPTCDISEVHFAFRDEPAGLRATDGPLGEWIRKEIAAKGIYALRKAWGSGMREITTGTHPIRVADDLAGFRVRVLESKITIDFYKALGASPTPMPMAETYTGLQTHLIDGCELPLATIETSKVYEVQKYLSMTNHNWSGLWLLINGDFWRSLPPDLQATIERNNDKYAALERADVQNVNSSTAQKLATQGLEVNAVDPSTFRARLKPYYATWKNAFGAAGWALLEGAAGVRLG